MTNNKVMAVVVVALMVVVGCMAAIGLSITNDNSDDSSYEHRVTIYGNANGDDKLDEDDISTLNTLITDSIDDWGEDYPFADANQDGIITQDDVDVVQKYLNGESTRLYYQNAFDRITWVNYPLGLKIGTETASIEFLPVLGLYDNLYATDDNYTINLYPDKYPNAQDKVVIGTSKNFTVEQVRTSGVETLFMYPVHGDYFWDKAVDSGLADIASIILLDTQGDRAVGDVLMLGIFFNVQERAQKFADWSDGIVSELSVIGDVIEKKEVDVINAWTTGFTKGQFSVCNTNFNPVGHYHHILEFQEQYRGSNTSTVNFEDFVNTATDDIIVIMHRSNSVSLEDFDSYCQNLTEQAFPNTEQLKNGTIYAIEWDCSPNLGGIAGMYLLASYLYPDNFDTEQGYEYLQYFLDNFYAQTGLDAHTGFFYAVTPVE
ncbi:MAG: hypothetical protein WCU80_12205 [Paludibacteraceae bacterium]